MVKIILHCSDSSFGNAALISKWHVQERGWSGIGYHYVILNGWLTSSVYNPEFNGHIETGRPLDDDPVVKNSEVGAHVRGHNYKSVGICLIGNSGNFSEKQLNRSLSLVHKLEKQFHTIQILQHSDLDTNKPHCAGLDMEKWNMNYNLFKELAGYSNQEFIL
jgi:hypothetical protein